MGKRVLVTGSSGFIGRYVVSELQKTGADVYGLDRNATALLAPEKAVTASLTDRAAVRAAVEAVRPDAVIHLAAIASPTHENTGEIYDINARGSENLLDALQAVREKRTRVLLSSTGGVYGNQPEPFYHEELPYRPANHYSYSKMVMEMISRGYADDLDITIVRPFNIIGVGQTKNFFVPKLVRAFLDRQPELCLGNIQTERDYVEAPYAARVFVRLLDAVPDFRAINICTGVATKGEEVIQHLMEITGHRPKIQITQQFVRANEVWRLVGSTARLEAFMGAEHAAHVRPVEQVLRDIVAGMAREAQPTR